VVKQLPFSDAEKQEMLLIKGVGTTVIARLEQIGFSRLSQLKKMHAPDLTKQIAEMLGNSCWHNSPMARNSIQAIIDLANKQ
jgi:nucleotidyltransferase/DNA polymerase involved in DNA repair